MAYQASTNLWSQCLLFQLSSFGWSSSAAFQPHPAVEQYSAWTVWVLAAQPAMRSPVMTPGTAGIPGLQAAAAAAAVAAGVMSPLLGAAATDAASIYNKQYWH